MTLRVHDSIGSEDAPIKILYINPNSSLHFTKETVDYLAGRVPAEVRLDFYTAPSAAPASIDGIHDGIRSTAIILDDLGLSSREAVERNTSLSEEYGAIVVACFSAHPLLPALQECLPSYPTKPPVLGIFEAGVYLALQLGRTFGIATTGKRWAHSLLFITTAQVIIVCLFL